MSSPRQPGWSAGKARLLVIDRASKANQALDAIALWGNRPRGRLPLAEVLEAMYQEQARQLHCLLPRRGGIEPADRAGGIAVQGPLRILSRIPAHCELVVRVFNQGNASLGDRA